MARRASAAVRRFSRRIWPAFLLYVVALIGAIRALESESVVGALRYAIGVLPALPLIGVISLVVQSMLSEDDEFQRVLWAEAMLWGTAITMAVTTVWGFLEVAGAPHLSLVWVFPFFTGSTLGAIFFLRGKYR
jgi:hypothetical protein